MCYTNIINISVFNFLHICSSPFSTLILMSDLQSYPLSFVIPLDASERRLDVDLPKSGERAYPMDAPYSVALVQQQKKQLGGNT